ncbi:hypothetical protein [Gordonia shandongensis]|uniref:hypothetical protein n=1 Tax=Gordonia shandongensis TaxID=376351 RepID=UPI000418C65C|nr:hypothetical protein [Gordonia shandongensis]
MTALKGIGPIALALIAAQLVVRGVLVATGDFYWDDLILIGQASSQPILSWDFLGHDHDGHFMPAAYLLVGVSTLIAPVQWWLPAATLVVMQAVASLAVWRMIRIIAPRARGQALAALAFYLFVPMTVSSFAWWAAGINTLPMQAAMAFVVGNAVLLTRDSTDRRRSLGLTVASIAAFVVALAFFEKSLFIVPVAMVAAVLAVRLERRPRWGEVLDYRNSALTLAVTRARSLWLGLGGVFVAWTALYLVVGSPTAGTHSVSQTAKLVWRSINEAIVPALAGAPWYWERWDPSPPTGLPEAWMIVAGWIVLAALIGMTCVLKRGVIGIWVCALLYAVGAQVPVMWNRSGDNTALELAQTMRYLPDTALVLTIAFALIAAAPRNVGAHAVVPDGDAVAARRSAVALSLSGVLLGVSAMISTMAFSASWRDGPTPDYLANAKESMAEMDGKVMFDQQLPLEVLLPVAYPNNQISHVFGRLRQRPEFTGSTDQLVILDDEGRLAPGAVTEARTFDGTRGTCARPDVDGPTEVPLSGPLIGWKWTFAVSYCADRDGEIEVRLDGGDPVRVRVRSGLHPVYFQADGHGAALHVRPVTPGLRLHVGSGRVGMITAVQDPP